MEKLLEVKLYKLGSVDESEYTRVVVVSKYNGKYVYCRHKQRNTWEIPGGHIETGEDWLTAAKRELYEETGATEVKLEPICVYSITKYALLCYADIIKMGALPESEIKEVALFDDQPNDLTYPEAHTIFYNKVKEVKGL